MVSLALYRRGGCGPRNGSRRADRNAAQKKGCIIVQPCGIMQNAFLSHPVAKGIFAEILSTVKEGDRE